MQIFFKKPFSWRGFTYMILYVDGNVMIDRENSDFLAAGRWGFEENMMTECHASATVPEDFWSTVDVAIYEQLIPEEDRETPEERKAREREEERSMIERLTTPLDQCIECGREWPVADNVVDQTGMCGECRRDYEITRSDED